MRRAIVTVAAAVFAFGVGAGVAFLRNRGGGEAATPAGEGAVSQASACVSPATVEPARITSTATSQGIVADPRNPAYDPTRLQKIGVSAWDVFAAEPRNEAWAKPVETNLSAYLGRSLDLLVPGDYSQLQVECRSATCRATLTVEKDRRSAMLDAIQFSPMAHTTTFGPGSRGEKIEFYLMVDNFPRQGREPDFHNFFLQANLLERLQRMRDLYDKIPVDHPLRKVPLERVKATIVLLEEDLSRYRGYRLPHWK